MAIYSYIDMHCDTLLYSLEGGYQKVYENDGMQSIKWMEQAKQMCQFFAIFFPPATAEYMAGEKRKLPPDDQLFNVLRENLLQAVIEHENSMAMAYSHEDIVENWKKGRSSAMLTIEDGRMVQGSLCKLSELSQKGVMAIALTWNHANCFGYPHAKEAKIMKRGLTDFGKEAVEEMNRLGILIDVSHLSDGGFYDVARITQKPFIASHSNCRMLTPHTRNLTDDMIRMLAERGGVAGINFCTEFIRQNREDKVSRIEDMAAHVLHFMKIGGEDCVGIGTDFDGITDTLEISHPTDMHLLFHYLKKHGATQRQLDKLASQNVLRVLHDVKP